MNEQVEEALCARCARAAKCTIPGDMGEIILSCEFFSSLDALVEEDSLSTESLDSSRSYGLCGDCENRGHCALRQREGGVWHCEEYC